MPVTSDKAPEGLPSGAKKVWVAAFNAAAKDGKADDAAGKIAWTAVKAKYRKSGESWVLKSHILNRALQRPVLPGAMDFFITKASTADGEMRFQAVWSDPLPDNILNGSHMSMELFDSFIAYSEVFGMPYVSVAHYPAYADGFGQAGAARSLYLDGEQFKVKGVFEDVPLGRAAFDAVRSDLEAGIPDNERIRWSIGFWDLSHYHGEQDYLFTRSSPTDVCPLCSVGIGGHIFTEGVLEHGALTRAPVNPRTPTESVEVRSSTTITTMLEDAASIVGEELAAELEKRAAESTRPQCKSVTRSMWAPLGGAKTLADAQAFLAAQELSSQAGDLWYLVQEVLWNILDDSATEALQYSGEVISLLSEFRELLGSITKPTQRSSTEVNMSATLQALIASLGGIHDPAVLTLEERTTLAAQMAAASTELGLVEETPEPEAPPEEPATTPPEAATESTLEQALRSLVAQQADTNALLRQAMGAQPSAVAAVPAPPQRQTVPPASQARSASQDTPQKPPSQLRAIAEQSVG